ncbi:putrescine aminotransferase [Aquamicrobium terrae]
MSMEEMHRWDQAHVVHPWSYAGPSLMIARAKGTRYWDADGREYLDALGGIQNCSAGHSRPELIEAARAQMEKLEYVPMHWNFTNEPAVELARTIATLAPGELNQTYFVSSGSEATESAVKLVRRYHYLRGDTKRATILCLKQGYHGATILATAATGFDNLQQGFGPLPGGIKFLTPPHAYRTELFGNEDPVEFCIRQLEQVIAEEGADTIAALMAEPVLTVGGVIVPPAEYWPAVSEICRRHGILVVADEVVTGFGRTGAWFASPAIGMAPDAIVFGKGVSSGHFPLSGVVMSDEIAQTIKAAPDGLMHGFTYCGHPVGCAVASRNIEILQDTGLLENSRDVGAYLLAVLKEKLGNSPIVGDVRGCGLLLAVELVSDKETRAPLQFKRQALADRIRNEHAVVVRSIGANIIIAPPLILSRAEADTIAHALEQVISTTKPDGTQS